jgi:invasion protein IalB
MSGVSLHLEDQLRPRPAKRFFNWWTVAMIVGALVVAVALVVKWPDLEAGADLVEGVAAKSDLLKLAQRKPTSSQAPAAPSSPAPPAAAPSASAPASADATPATPQRTETIVQDAWVISCVETAGTPPKRSCSAVQQVVEQKQKRVVFAWVIGRTAEGALTNVFQTPTGVQLQKGLDFKLGSSAPRNASFVVCVPQRCEAALAMDDAVVKDAKAALGANAVATVMGVDGRTFEFVMPVKGLDKVLTTLGAPPGR